MPLKVRRWPQARADQQDIWLAVAEDSLRAADGVIDRIDEVIFMLAEQPEAGRARDDLGPGLRYFPAGSYLIFYSLEPGTLDVRRIMHGARDVTEELFDRD